MSSGIPAIVADLHPPRLPAELTAFGYTDLLAAFGIGLLLAALVLVLATPALRRRPRRLGLEARIQATARLAPEERLLALARLLHEVGGRLPDAQRAALYRGDGVDPARIEALIRAAPRRAG